VRVWVLAGGCEALGCAEGGLVCAVESSVGCYEGDGAGDFCAGLDVDGCGVVEGGEV
jgi:hypothetical protein